MAQGQLRSFLSLIALVSLIGGTFATALGLMKIGEDPSSQMMTDEEYIIPAAVGNTLCVIFLIWLTATITTRSTMYKLLVIVTLIVGLIGEIYLTFFFTKPPAVYGTYVLVVVNFLIRTFYVLEYVQDTWSPVSWTDYQGAPRYSAPSVEKKYESEKKPEGEKKKFELTDAQREVSKEAREKLRQSIIKFKEPGDFSGSTITEAEQAINKEAAAGKTVDQIHKAAKSLLRYKDGSVYTGAGRRRA